MPGNPKPRKRRQQRPGIPREIKGFMGSYKCGHCHSRVAGVRRDASGVYHMTISHDNGCPVLGGVLSSLHDSIRAAIAAGARSEDAE
jgi:hypothetical protein